MTSAHLLQQKDILDVEVLTDSVEKAPLNKPNNRPITDITSQPKNKDRFPWA